MGCSSNTKAFSTPEEFLVRLSNAETAELWPVVGGVSERKHQTSGVNTKLSGYIVCNDN